MKTSENSNWQTSLEQKQRLNKHLINKQQKQLKQILKQNKREIEGENRKNNVLNDVKNKHTVRHKIT